MIDLLFIITSLISGCFLSIPSICLGAVVISSFCTLVIPCTLLGALVGICTGALGVIVGGIVGAVGGVVVLVLGLLGGLLPLAIVTLLLLILSIFTLGIPCILEAIVILLFAAGLALIGGIIGALIGGLLGFFIPCILGCAIAGIPSLICLGVDVICWVMVCLPSFTCIFFEGLLSIGACLLIPISLPLWWLAACPFTCWFGCPLLFGLSLPFYCIFWPCCFEIPYFLHYGGHILVCAACNLIDLVWLAATPMCTVASCIGGTGAWILCPFCIWVPPLTFAGTCGLVGGKFCYLCSSFPYTCWLEPVYCCWLSFDALFYFFGCLCAPVLFLCTIPLLPFSWCCSFFSTGALGIATCTVGCITDIGIMCTGTGCCGTGTAISGMCLASLCTPAGLCVAGSAPVLSATASVCPSTSQFMTTLTAVCPINAIVGLIINNLVPIFDAIIDIIRTVMFW